jgi:catechol 2,3-dioxygenase-like lactoylglutathione lyase family enzyme
VRRIHIALAVDELERSIADYNQRLGAEPVVIVAGRYALWRTAEVNLSVTVEPGEGGRLRHLGFEDDTAEEATESEDVKAITWEHFAAEEQTREIEESYGPLGEVGTNDQSNARLLGDGRVGGLPPARTWR